MKKYPLVTIITATFNAENNLQKTIDSIRDQDYPNIEYIIVDGASIDNTVSILKSNLEFISAWISEKDNGIYDAWNKGIKISNGQWIAFLGAGDCYIPTAVSDYINYINSNSSDLNFVSSKVELVDSDGLVLYEIGSKWEWSKFCRFMNVAHVGSFHARKIFDEVGIFDITYKIAGDYELLMRKKSELKAGFFEKVTAKMLDGGISKSTNILNEDYIIKLKLRVKHKLILKYFYIIDKIKLKIRINLEKSGIYFKLKS